MRAVKSLQVWELALISLSLICLVAGAIIKISQPPASEPASRGVAERLSPDEKALGEEIVQNATERARAASEIKSSRDLPAGVWWIPPSGQITANRTAGAITYSDGRQITQAGLSERAFKKQAQSYLSAFKDASSEKLKLDSGDQAIWIKTPQTAQTALVYVPKEKTLLTLSGEWGGDEISGLREGAAR